jgi:hypothetical protein
MFDAVALELGYKIYMYMAVICWTCLLWIFM